MRSRTLLIALFISALSLGAASEPLVVARVVRVQSAGTREDAFRLVSRDGSSADHADSMLRLILDLKADRVIFLVDDRLPLSALNTLLSISSKAGYPIERVDVYAVPENRITLTRLRGFEVRSFSEDPMALITRPEK
jgi:hypothetical protein